ncbi:MAG TPA: XdhC family protein [Polyangiaceae bacterium]|nr:XdhC family protein [Polyangiaceae bacterium]
MKRAVLEAVVAASNAKTPIVLVTPLRSGTERAWSPGDGTLDAVLREAAERALAIDEALTVDTAGGPVFLKPINPPLRLFIVGAVHLAVPLSSIASTLGYGVTLVDPRSAFARAERWPGAVDVRCAWPDEALPAAKLDARSAVVTLTHDPKIDDPALQAALGSRAFYVGALGSRKTHASRLRRLEAAGFAEADLARVHGPIGLPIGARSPGEIAVAILAQMTDVLRRSAAPPTPGLATPGLATPGERAS